MTTVSNFEIADHLETDNDIKGFLQEVASTGDVDDLIGALNTAAKAKGMTALAKETGMTRAGLYRALSGESTPNFETVSKVVKAFGCKLAIV
jgi:probable addiction module antidote protein